MCSTYRNPDTVDAKIAEAQDARPVGDDADLRVGVGPVAQQGADGLALLDGDVEGLRARVERRVLQADVADGGRVDQGHELGHVVHEQAVEEVGVLLLERAQVQVLVDGRRPRVDHLHGPVALRLDRLDNVRDQTRQVLAEALLGREGEACGRRTTPSAMEILQRHVRA